MSSNFSNLSNHIYYQRVDRSKEFYSISGRMLVKLKDNIVFKVNIYGDAVESYVKEDFVKYQLTYEEAKKFKEDFIEYFI